MGGGTGTGGEWEWGLERGCHMCPYVAPHDDALARHMLGHRPQLVWYGTSAGETTKRQAHRAAGEDLERLLEELHA